MKSTISLFNATLYRKTMKRFWPLWAAYSVLLAFMLPLNLLNYYIRIGNISTPAEMDRMMWHMLINVPHLLTTILPILLVGAALCAMAVYGYLYNHRSTCMMHALPMRRETMFFTQFLAGLSFMLLPLLAVTAVTAGVEIIAAPAGMLGQALMSLVIWAGNTAAISLFFFSLASFCAMFTGHILAMPVFYGVINGLASALFALITAMMNLFFFGYQNSFSPTWLKWLTPVWNLMDAVHWNSPDEPANELIQGNLANGLVPVVYAVIGLVLTVLALMVYRRRQLETAGDVVSVPLVRPLFRLGAAFCTGVFFGSFTTMFFGWRDHILPLTVSVILWSVVGWFAAEMLLEKSFRVFHRWKGAVVLSAAMGLLCFSFHVDLFGVEDRVPEPENVSSLAFSMQAGYPNDGAFSIDDSTTDPETIAKLVKLHQTVLDAYHSSGDDFSSVNYEDSGWVNLEYRLNNGRIISRSYNSLPLSADDLDDPDTMTGLFAQLGNDRELVAQYGYHFDLVETGTLSTVSLEQCIGPDPSYTQNLQLEQLTGEQRMALWKAVRQDYDDGNIGFRTPLLTPDFMDSIYATHIVFSWAAPDHSVEYDPSAASISYDWNVNLVLTTKAQHTLALLKEYHALPEGFSLAKRTYEVQEDGNVLETGNVPAEF